jgi:hypothetical protein
VFSRCKIRVQESARMQDFAPFTPAVQQLDVVEGYYVKKLRGPAGYLLTLYYFYPCYKVSK